MNKTIFPFNKFLKEDISLGSLDRAMAIIIKYLRKKTGQRYFAYPGEELYKGNKHGTGVGIRLYSPTGGTSVRFNWKTNPTSAGLFSVDVWDGKKGVTHIEWKNKVSLVKTLPVIVDAIVNWGSSPPKMVYSMPDGVPLEESIEDTVGSSHETITEAVAGSDLETMYNDIVDMAVTPRFKKTAVYVKYKSAGYKIFDEIQRLNPEQIVKVGTKYEFQGLPADIKRIKGQKDQVLNSVGASKAKVTRSSAGGETYEPNDSVKEIEDNRERLTFELQLNDLENLLKLTISGAANALFVSGRGGVGKTHTTEKILAEMGLRDGTGYFKNTGSASTAGIYSLLFKYKDGIIFFDDSDDALKDQGSRNLLKAATDTKKIRKLVWNKMGKNIVDPDEDMTDEEILAQGLLPRWFEFTGKIIFISNLPLNKLDPDGALRTRAFIVDINPTEMEVYDFMEKIVSQIKLDAGLQLDQKERLRVVKLLRKGTSKQTANLRKLSRGLNMAGGAIAAGITVSDKELERMIRTYD